MTTRDTMCASTVGLCDLNLWPADLQIARRVTLAMRKLRTRYELSAKCVVLVSLSCGWAHNRRISGIIKHLTGQVNQSIDARLADHCACSSSSRGRLVQPAHHWHSFTVPHWHRGNVASLLTQRGATTVNLMSCSVFRDAPEHKYDKPSFV